MRRTGRPGTCHWSCGAVVRVVLVGAMLVGVAAAQSLDDLRAPPPESWPQHGRTPEAQRYSPLTAIDSSNVSSLRLVWVHELGHDGPAQGNPAVWGDTMFVSTPSGVIALDAANGDIRWRFEDEVVRDDPPVLAPRAPRGSPVVFDGHVFATLREPVVVALDADDGRLVWRTEVGAAGLAEGFSSNPLFADGLLIVGPTGADYGGSPGRIVALDATTGAVRWTFKVVPDDEEDPAYATWQPVGPSWARGVGGASAWNVGAYDPDSEIVVFGTGQPLPWHRDDHRRRNDGPPSRDLYSSSFVAVDVETGALRWFHQVVPGDEWEFDQHTVPIIVGSGVADGADDRVALLATTTGFVVRVEASTGRYLGAHQLFDAGNVHIGYDDAGEAVIDDTMRYLSDRAPTGVCPGTRWAHVAPGAFSPRTGLLYRPNDTVCVQRGLRPTLTGDAGGVLDAFWLHAEPRSPSDYFHRWGALSAIDPRSGVIVWEFTSPYPHDAGVLVTAGDLVFSVFADRTFRAFDAGSGAVLWEQLLTSHGEGSPITYAVQGRQYVAVLVGHERGVAALPASGLPMSAPGRPTLFVFALP